MASSIRQFWAKIWPVGMILALILFGMAAGISLVVISMQNTPERIPLEHKVDEETQP